ncbi:MAG: TrkH family potassium uptake protein [Clostridia bacterium]|nr:TrkH family potassium uptake protein [Clostridia bacterium]
MNKKLVFNTLGRLLLLEAVIMLPPLFVSLIYADGCASAYLKTIGLLIIVSLPIARFVKPADKSMYTREGMAIAGLSWICISFMGSLPLVFARVCGLADAFFETASGFTTTGATIFTDVEVLPASINFWRCFTHWFGGMGVLVLTTAIMPSSGNSASRLARAESSGPQFSKLVPKLGDNSKVLYIIYAALTLMLAIALKIAGMSTFESIIHALSTAGTGGFSNKGLSIGHYDSVAIEVIISVFMLLFGISFAVYFRLLARDYKSAFRNEELWLFGGIAVSFTLLIALNISKMYGGFAGGLRNSFFQVSSIVSTTGYTTADFNLWPTFSKTLLFLLMIVGSCAGSTAGGLKMIRLLLLAKLAARETTKAFSPRKVKVIKLDGKSVPEEMLSQIAIFFFVYAALAVVGMITLSLSGCDLTEAVSGAVACISNIGPAYGRLGASGNFAFLNSPAKIIMSLIMLAGRLEFYPLLILLVPAAWRKS